MTDKLRELSKGFMQHPKSKFAIESNIMAGLKDWAYDKGFSITTIRVPIEVKGANYYLQLTANRLNKLLYDCKGLTEHAVVLEVCEFILRKKL